MFPCNNSSLCLLSVLDMEQVSRVPNRNYSDIVTSAFPGAGDVWFSLNGTTYQNNSIVMLEYIGVGDDALLCITNLTACYQPNVNDTGKVVPALGNWYFPNGTRVPSNKVICHVRSGSSIEPEVRWWFVCTAEEVEWKGSTAVRYLMQ